MNDTSLGVWQWHMCHRPPHLAAHCSHSGISWNYDSAMMGQWEHSWDGHSIHAAIAPDWGPWRCQVAGSDVIVGRWRRQQTRTTVWQVGVASLSAAASFTWLLGDHCLHPGPILAPACFFNLNNTAENTSLILKGIQPKIDILKWTKHLSSPMLKKRTVIRCICDLMAVTPRLG